MSSVTESDPSILELTGPSSEAIVSTLQQYTKGNKEQNDDLGYLIRLTRALIVSNDEAVERIKPHIFDLLSNRRVRQEFSSLPVLSCT
jgi:hypothetical protein